MGRDTNVGNVSAGTSLDTTGWKKGTKELKDSARETKEATEKSLRELAGHGSELHGILKVIQGGVVNEIGKQFSEATGKVVEMRDALREGKITQEEMARSVAESIPLVGSFVKGFLDLRELLTGEKEEIARIKEEAASSNAFFDTWAESLGKARREAEAIAIAINNSNRSAESAFGSPTLKTAAEIKNAYDSQFGKGGSFDRDQDDAIEKNNKSLADLRDKRNNSAEAKALDAAQEKLYSAKQYFSENNDNPITYAQGAWNLGPGGAQKKYDDALEAYNATNQVYDPDIKKLNAANDGIRNNRETLRTAKENEFKTENGKKLLDSEGEYHLGITGRQSRFGGGIACAGNRGSGDNVQERIAEILAANAKDAKRAADDGKRAADALQQLVGNRK